MISESIESAPHIGLEERVNNVSATAFVTLFARALETQSASPILRDPQAVAIVEKLRPHFARSQRALEQQLAQGRLPQMVVVTMALRARRMDAYARDFLARHPDGVIVNLGCGLDTRFHRIDDGRAVVYDLDLPAMIDLKRTLLNEGDHYHFIAASVLDMPWMDRLDASVPYLFIAEGLFMYLSEQDVKGLVVELRRRFPGSELVCEVFNRFWLRDPWKRWVDRKMQRQLSFSADASFQSGLDDSREMEPWAEGIRFLDDWSYFDDGEPKLGIFNVLRRVSFFRRIQWTVHYRLGESGGNGEVEK